jgi:hypothetical protein
MAGRTEPDHIKGSVVGPVVGLKPIVRLKAPRTDTALLQPTSRKGINHGLAGLVFHRRQELVSALPGHAHHAGEIRGAPRVSPTIGRAFSQQCPRIFQSSYPLSLPLCQPLGSFLRSLHLSAFALGLAFLVPRLSGQARQQARSVRFSDDVRELAVAVVPCKVAPAQSSCLFGSLAVCYKTAFRLHDKGNIAALLKSVNPPAAINFESGREGAFNAIDNSPRTW